jgi:integrase
MTRSGSLDKILKEQIQTLATTLQPQTVLAYGSALNQFLDYLHIAFPNVRHVSQLRRDPHLLGWFRWLCEQDDPPLDDQLLQQELRRTDDLHSNALLLMRLTGIRLGECVHLALDCLRPLGDDQWALHVPLGKLHTERLVPVDEDVRQIISRILTLRAEAPASQLEQSPGWLLPRCGGFWSLYLSLRYAAIHAGERAGCSQRVIPHRLRHTFAQKCCAWASACQPSCNCWDTNIST